MPNDTKETVTIPVAQAEKIYELFEIVQFADRHFHGCQATNFRQHVVSVCGAPNVKDAFDSLKNTIDRAKGGE